MCVRCVNQFTGNQLLESSGALSIDLSSTVQTVSDASLHAGPAQPLPPSARRLLLLHPACCCHRCCCRRRRRRCRRHCSCTLGDAAAAAAAAAATAQYRVCVSENGFDVCWMGVGSGWTCPSHTLIMQWTYARYVPLGYIGHAWLLLVPMLYSMDIVDRLTPLYCIIYLWPLSLGASALILVFIFRWHVWQLIHL